MQITDIYDKISNYVIGGINQNWNDLQKIRYVYLKLAQFIEKNTDFFLNEKLGDFAFSKEQIDDIYHKDFIFSREIDNNNQQYQVICKSAAMLLNNILNRLNINSELVHTIENEDGISHWFVVAKDENNKQYFLTLVADLPLIKNGLKTIHFANDLMPNYVIPDDTELSFSPVDDSESVYEIDHEVLAEKELQELDLSIGYGKLYDLYSLLSLESFRNIFFEFSEMNSDIYTIFKKCFNIKNDTYSTLIDFITEDEINSFINEIDKYLEDYFKTNFQMSTKDYLIRLLEKNGITVDEKMSLGEILHYNKKSIKELKKKNTTESKDLKIITLLNNVEIIKNRFLDFKDVRKLIWNHDGSISNDDLYERYILTKKKLSYNELSPLLNRIAYYFLDNKLTIDSNVSYVPLEYIVDKFLIMFPLLFDCNFENNKTFDKTFFSIQNYSEQVSIIKTMLDFVFPELTKQNCDGIEDYDDRYTPIANRIQMFPLKDKKTREYCIGFKFGKSEIENSIEYIYIPSENLLRRRNPIADKDKYWICSERFNETLHRIEQLENNLEVKKNK